MAVINIFNTQNIQQAITLYNRYNAFSPFSYFLQQMHLLLNALILMIFLFSIRYFQLSSLFALAVAHASSYSDSNFVFFTVNLLRVSTSRPLMQTQFAPKKLIDPCNINGTKGSKQTLLTLFAPKCWKVCKQQYFVRSPFTPHQWYDANTRPQQSHPLSSIFMRNTLRLFPD